MCHSVISIMIAWITFSMFWGIALNRIPIYYILYLEVLLHQVHFVLTFYFERATLLETWTLLGLVHHRLVFTMLAVHVLITLIVACFAVPTHYSLTAWWKSLHSWWILNRIYVTLAVHLRLLLRIVHPVIHSTLKLLSLIYARLRVRHWLP